MRPSRMKLYSSSRLWRCSGAASARGGIGCSTRLKRVVGVGAGDHEADADGLQRDGLAVGGADDRRGGGGGHRCGSSWIMIEQQCSMKTYRPPLRSVKIHRTPMSAETSTTKRRYEKRARAAQEQATRLRVIEAAIELHGTVGPARTTISAIAERAGVRRATVYRHFPDERALFLGCSGAWRGAQPAARSRDVGLDRGSRRAAGRPRSTRSTRWYERVEPMLSAVLRDVDAMPVIAELQAGRLAYLADVEDGLASGWGARGKAAKRLRATIGLALDFFAWRTLNERGLSRDGRDRRHVIRRPRRSHLGASSMTSYGGAIAHLRHRDRAGLSFRSLSPRFMGISARTVVPWPGGLETCTVRRARRRGRRGPGARSHVPGRRRRRRRRRPPR